MGFSKKPGWVGFFLKNPGFFQPWLIPSEDKKTILETFLKLPYKILWKYEDDSLGELPKNIMIGSWMPQQDILGQLYWWKIWYFNSTYPL